MVPEKLTEVINFAAEKEQEAADFYYDLASKSKSPALGIRTEENCCDGRRSQRQIEKTRFGKNRYKSSC